MSASFDLTQRKTAASGNVDYTTPITIHQSKRQKITAMLWIIRRSYGCDLKIKLTKYMMTSIAGGPSFANEECSITLSPEATQSLYNELQKGYSMLGHDKAGEYISIRVADGHADFGNRNPGEVVSALLGVLQEEELLEHLKNAELGEELVKALRYSVRLDEMKMAMHELRDHLNDPTLKENTYQSWCEKHPWSFGNCFVMTDKIRTISRDDQVDILLPGILAGYRDVVELKLPTASVIHQDKSHQTYYFSSEVSKAIGQCHHYLDVLDEAARRGLHGAEEVVAYHPEATLVIGRSNTWNDEQFRALHGLNSRLNGIRVITYDHLLAQGDNLVSYLSNELQHSTE